MKGGRAGEAGSVLVLELRRCLRCVCVCVYVLKCNCCRIVGIESIGQDR